MENQRYFYLYKTTNLINGKYYYGIHTTINLDDNYMGSGKYLKRTINKYGKENFNKEIISFHKDYDELRLAEKEIVTEELLKNELCMNIVIGGGYGFYPGERQKEIAKKGGKQFGKHLKEDIKFRQKNSETISNRRAKNLKLRDRENGYLVSLIS